MAEWSNAHDSKSCYVGTRTEVRILFSAPPIFFKNALFLVNFQQKQRIFYYINLLYPQSTPKSALV